MTTPLPQPPVAPPGLWLFPTPRRSRLSNGIELMIFDLPGQHVISVELVLDVPLQVEDREREGVATICARVIDEGTRTHPGEEFAELLETEGAGFGIEITLAGLQLGLDVPASRLEPALKLFAEAVTEPALADTDVDRHVQLRLGEIEQARANSAQAASIAFREATFDAGTRAARMNGGQPETLPSVTGASVRDFYGAHYGPVGAVLIMAGDFEQDPTELAESCLGGWTNPDQRPTGSEATGPRPRQTLLIDRPGAVQADIRYGGFGIDRLDPRWADITVASYALGGAFLSRLNAVLREDKGYTYGVRMNFAPLHSGGSYAVQGSFRTEVVVDALTLTRGLIDLSAAPLQPEEVTESVNYFTGVSPLRYATASGITGQAANQVLNGLGDGYVDANLAALRAVTPASATAAYRSLVDLDNLTLVMVGDASVLADPLRSSGFSELEIIT